MAANKPRVNPVDRRVAAQANIDPEGMDPEMVATIMPEAARRVAAQKIGSAVAYPTDGHNPVMDHIKSTMKAFGDYMHGVFKKK